MEAAASCCCGLSAAAAAAAAAKASSGGVIGGMGFLPMARHPRWCIIASSSFTSHLSLASNRSSFALSIRSSSGRSETTKASSPPRRWRPSPPSSSSKTLVLRGSKKQKRKDREPENKKEEVVVAGQKAREWEGEECLPSVEEASISVGTLYQNGDPLGRRELGRCVVRWISQGMRSMASDFASAEIQGEFSELRQRLGLGGAAPNGTGSLAFVIQAQRYLYAVPMPKGLEALCFKACTHYPTLFDHFQRELRDVLQDLQRQAVFADWRSTQSWKLLKEFANSSMASESPHRLSVLCSDLHFQRWFLLDSRTNGQSHGLPYRPPASASAFRLGLPLRLRPPALASASNDSLS